jgi:hypothetical protein
MFKPILLTEINTFEMYLPFILILPFFLCIGPPEPPLSVEFSDIGADYLTLSWEEGFAGGYMDTTLYQVEYTRVMDTRSLTTSCPAHLNHCNVTGEDQQSYFVAFIY